MKKLKLDLEALAVESFEATPRPRGASGTVYGHASNICPQHQYPPDDETIATGPLLCSSDPRFPQAPTPVVACTYVSECFC